MFPAEVKHYLREFHRVLAPNGRVWASFFIVNCDLRDHIQGTENASWGLTFRNEYSPGCYVNVVQEHRQAVAFEEELLCWIIEQSGLALDHPILWGNWSGFRVEPKNGQDAVILRQAR